MPKHILSAHRQADGTSIVQYDDGSTAIVSLDQTEAGQQLDHWLADGGVWEAAPPTLDELKAKAMATIITYADNVTAKITTQYPAAEVASWPLQLVEARAVIAGQALPNDATLVSLVNASNGALILPVLADSVIKKAAIYAQIVGLVQALRVQGQTQIAAAKAPAEIQPILDNLAAAAVKAAAQFGL